MTITGVLAIEQATRVSGRQQQHLSAACIASHSKPAGQPGDGLSAGLLHTAPDGVPGWAAPRSLLSLSLVQHQLGDAPVQLFAIQPPQQLTPPQLPHGVAIACLPEVPQAGPPQQQAQMQHMQHIQQQAQQFVHKSVVGRDSPAINPVASGSWLDFLGSSNQPPMPAISVPAPPPPAAFPSHGSPVSLGGGMDPGSNLAAPTSATGMQHHQQLQMVQSQIGAQQKFIRSLHKWAGSAAAAVRQLQEQSRSATAPIKACEGDIAELKSQVAALSNHCASKDARIDALVQELSDVKSQLVEVEKLASELEPHLKRRRLMASESHTHDTNLPQGLVPPGTDGQASGDLPVPREGASASTDVINNKDP